MSKSFFVLSLFFLCLSSFGQRLSGEDTLYYIDFAPDFSFFVIETRFQSIESDMGLTYNQKICAFVNYFTVRNRDYTRKVLNRETAYFGLFEKALRNAEMPTDLKYLTVVESGINPIALSPVGARGLWQFMPSTGRSYGLKINDYVDERLDPIKSTKAACAYLKDLYVMFNDWELALAAYNCGPGNVRKAIRRSGYKKTFWQIYRYLPRETRSYVPQFLAINYVMRYAGEHNLEGDYYDFYDLTDTITLKGYTNLDTLAAQLDICRDDISRLNPELLKNVVPKFLPNYKLILPKYSAEVFEKNTNEIVQRSAKKTIEVDNYQVRKKKKPSSTYGKERIVYRVKKGDVLGTIASRYRVRNADLRKWNKMGNSSIIKIGQRLYIYKDPSYFSKSNTTTQRRSIPSSNVHFVRSGESLWSISRMYKGLTVERLKSVNNLTRNTLNIGQKLKLS